MKSHTQKKLSWFDRMMAAITFAEANEHKTALQFLNDEPYTTKEMGARDNIKINSGFAK